MRYRTLFFTIPGVAAALALSGCGSEQAGSGSSPGPSNSGVVQPAKPQTDITVSVQANGTSAAKTWRLTCEPVGGDHPDAQHACNTLSTVEAQSKDPFAPTPANQLCTQIYGGPQVATVKGTWQGKPVDSKVTRKNGCEIQRWKDLGPVLGKPPTAS